MNKNLQKNPVAIGRALIASIVLGSLLTISVQAEENKNSESYIVSEDIMGVYGNSVDSFSAAQVEEDLNWEVGDIFIEAQKDVVRIKVPALGEDVSFDLEMYPSKMGMDSQNKMIGIEKEKTSDRYSIVRFIIEKDASYLYLFKTNSDLLGKIVVHLGIIDNYTGGIYLTQFEENQFNYDAMYSKLSNGNYTDTELTDIELGYFSMQTLNELKRSFSDVEDMSVRGSASASVSDGNRSETFEDTQGKILDELLNSGTPINLNSRSLIEDIPDSVYKTQVNGEWTSEQLDWKNGTQVGYVVYHMKDIGSKNVLNYALRYYATANYNWDAQRFEISYNLTHNMWVQYIAGTNSIVIFDDRPSNARIIVDADLTLRANEEDSLGYFTSVTHNAYKNGNLENKIARFIISKVPYLGSAQEMVETLSGAALSTGSTYYLEGNKTVKLETGIDGLKYARNGKSNGNYDYIGMTAYGTNVTYVSWHYEFAWQAQ